jgi:uncharacterized protein YjiS (DUF1127 family)
MSIRTIIHFQNVARDAIRIKEIHQMWVSHQIPKGEIMDHILASGIAQRQAGFLRRIAQAAQLMRQRRALALLDPHLLRDIGIDATAQAAEGARPVWDVPKAWRSR